MKILKLKDFKKEQKDFDTSRLSPESLKRLDYYIEVQRLGLLDRLTWLETTEMHRLINDVSVKTNEELISAIEKKVDELNELKQQAEDRGLKINKREVI